MQDSLETLYVIRHGAFKTVHVSRNGHEKVTGFHLPADMLGLDAIYERTHGYDAYAIEDSGSYLGLTIETVSRTISRFQSDRLLSVHQRREVQLTDIEELARLVA